VLQLHHACHKEWCKYAIAAYPALAPYVDDGTSELPMAGRVAQQVVYRCVLSAAVPFCAEHLLIITIIITIIIIIIIIIRRRRRRGVTGCVQAATPQRTPARKKNCKWLSAGRHSSETQPRENGLCG
jgi:hypothetical protein